MSISTTPAKLVGRSNCDCFQRLNHRTIRSSSSSKIFISENLKKKKKILPSFSRGHPSLGKVYFSRVIDITIISASPENPTFSRKTKNLIFQTSPRRDIKLRHAAEYSSRTIKNITKSLKSVLIKFEYSNTVQIMISFLVKAACLNTRPHFQFRTVVTATYCSKRDYYIYIYIFLFFCICVLLNCFSIDSREIFIHNFL